MTGNRNIVINGLLKLHILACLVFIFAPIIGSFVFSLNSDRFPSLPLGHFSLQWYRLILEDPFVWAGFFNTVFVGAIVAVIATTLGFGGAYTDFRYNFIGKNAYLALALLPPTIPVVIMGLAMLAFLSRISLSGGTFSVIIAHGVMCSPFAMAIIRLRLSQMDPDLEAASWNLGGNEWATLRHVIMPFTKPAIFAALFITMAVSFDEFAVAWFVSGLHETLPVKILGFLQGQVSPRINAIGSLAFLSSITLIVFAQMLMRNPSTGPVEK
ncbi:ABC transporter permease [Oricola nitratireducens]|uniref:ABC transporter permease n=1 Tax=Oricola nitratireducens TaxID=2775868 RepID=UPI001866D3D5|nr:ABC transporter permease [Oricola nitratireducens]